MLYRFLKFTIAIGIRLYYREIRILNREELDAEGPAILIANHPNTLMDAWIMGYINRHRVHFMAKATFFNSPLKRKMLGALGMIPINRKSDGVVEGVANKDSFEACYELLENGGMLVIFPEGTSFAERKLRELKTGTARIALEVESRNNGNLDLRIIPVGLNYIDGDSFRGSVMVHIGKSISVGAFLAEYQTSPGIAAKKLTERFRTELSRVFVTLDDDAKAQLSDRLCYLFDSKYSSGRKKGVRQSIGMLKQFQERLDVLSVTSPWKIEQISTDANALSKTLGIVGIRPDFLDRPYRSSLYLRQTLQSYFFLLLTIPFFVIGFFHNALTFFAIGKGVSRLTKEVEYHAPLVVLFGLFLYPLTYIGWCILFNALFHPSFLLLLMYGISLPLTGLFAHFFLRYIRHLLSKQQFSRFAKRRKIIFQQLKTQRSELNSLIFND